MLETGTAVSAQWRPKVHCEVQELSYHASGMGKENFNVGYWHPGNAEWVSFDAKEELRGVEKAKSDAVEEHAEGIVEVGEEIPGVELRIVDIADGDPEVGWHWTGGE